ncbi:flavodoxin domain-containing protein [Demequina lutea]|uniref:Menaquinone-dependent protoporphyrinogen oxidase n=1 Tax=Demequina lutea TaxID=431489 RepID=A0A7Z0CIH1_9MICO|nr:flavodoxin domain-containing protein [Demequina lutea]NYI42571.1 menaquinone-dependent protoporphyrinogen oxidase [Demequina lutea]
MNVLVAYSSRHGATAGIAEHIATHLGKAGVPATALSVDKVTDVEGYDAVVLGASTYMFRWQKEAVRFAREYAEHLAKHPLWLFSSGPIGTDLVNKQGVDALVASRPKEFDELVDLLHPVAEKVFFGAYDPTARPIGMSERLIRTMPAARDGLPAGDFRDWPAIEAWAQEIAAELKGEAASA